MSAPKYRVRLVLEQDHVAYNKRRFGWGSHQGRTLFDASPNLDAALQAFDDALATLDAKVRADELRESDY